MGYLKGMSGQDAGHTIERLAKHGSMTAREAADLLDEHGKDGALLRVGMNIPLTTLIQRNGHAA